MQTFRTAITVPAPAGRMWAVLVDVENWPAPTASVTSVRGLDGSGVALGSRLAAEQSTLRKAV